MKFYWGWGKQQPS